MGIGIVGYLRRPLAWGDRILLMAAGFAAIIAPTGTFWWDVGVTTAAVFLVLNWFVPKFTFGTLTHAAWLRKAEPDAGKP